MTTPWWTRSFARLGNVKRKWRRQRRMLGAGLEHLEVRRLLTLRIWDGGALFTDHWTDRQNWVSNIAPVSGDSLLFPDSIRFTDRSLVNNFPAGTSFDDISFEGEGYLIRGNRITITGDLKYAPQSETAIGNSKLNLDIAFADGDHRVEIVAKQVLPEELQFNGSLSDTGTGRIFVSGDAIITFGGTVANSINSHAIVIDNPTAIGDSLLTRLVLDKPNNVKAIDGDLEVGHRANVRPGTSGIVTTTRKTEQINSNSIITVRDGGELAIAKETIRDLTLDSGDLFVDQVFDAAFRGGNSIEGSLTLGGVVTVNGESSSIVRNQAKSNPTIELGGNTTFVVAAGAVLELRSKLAGGDLIKAGPGDLSLFAIEGNNSHDDTVALDGRLFLENLSTGQIAIPHDLFIETGATVIHNKTNDLIADDTEINLSGGTFQISNGVRETIESIVANDLGNLIVQNVGTRLFVTGDTSLRNASELEVRDQAAAILQSQLTLDHSTANVEQASLSLTNLRLSAGVLSSSGIDSSLILAGQVSTTAETIESEINGDILLSPGEHFFTVPNGAAINDLVIAAVIRDGGPSFNNEASIQKLGAGRMLLSGDNSYQGNTKLAQGTLVINGTHSFDQKSVLVSNGTLIGNGSVREIVQVGGTLNPGVGIGRLTATDRVFLGANSTLGIQINGGGIAKFDQLITGELALGNPAAPPTLDARLGGGFTPNPGQSFKIVNVLGSSVQAPDRIFRDVQGNQLPEGAVFQIGGLDFTISYKGGNGNDVVITRNTPPAFVNIGITPEITEGDKVFVSGKITETNPHDTFFLDVDWGDGSARQTFPFPPGSSLNVKVGHRYLDDGPGVDDIYRVRLHWRDEFGGTKGANLTTIVHNAAPTIEALTTSLPPVKVGQTFTLQGLISDRSPRDTVRVYVQWGVNQAWEAIDLKAGSTTFTFQHVFATAGLRKITVLLVDDDLGIALKSLTIDVK